MGMCSFARMFDNQKDKKLCGTAAVDFLSVSGCGCYAVLCFALRFLPFYLPVHPAWPR